jgi:hypothetical protein
MTEFICQLQAKRAPWNKGKLIGAKPPLRPKHAWAIRSRLQLSGRVRDLALLNLGIDSKLRGCDPAFASSMSLLAAMRWSVLLSVKEKQAVRSSLNSLSKPAKRSMPT